MTCGSSWSPGLSPKAASREGFLTGRPPSLLMVRGRRAERLSSRGPPVGVPVESLRFPTEPTAWCAHLSRQPPGGADSLPATQTAVVPVQSVSNTPWKCPLLMLAICSVMLVISEEEPEVEKTAKREKK